MIETNSENQLEPNVCGSTPVQLMNISCSLLILKKNVENVECPGERVVHMLNQLLLISNRK